MKCMALYPKSSDHCSLRFNSFKSMHTMCCSLAVDSHHGCGTCTLQLCKSSYASLRCCLAAPALHKPARASETLSCIFSSISCHVRPFDATPLGWVGLCVVYLIQVFDRVAQGRSNHHFARVETCTSIGACTRQRGRKKRADLLGSKPTPCQWTCEKCDLRCVGRLPWRHACRTWCRLPSKSCRTRRKNVVPSTLPKDFLILRSTDVWSKKPSKRCVAEATNTGECACLETSKRT